MKSYYTPLSKLSWFIIGYKWREFSSKKYVKVIAKSKYEAYKVFNHCKGKVYEITDKPAWHSYVCDEFNLKTTENVCVDVDIFYDLMHNSYIAI